jgi:hypothetical protein
MKEQFCELNLMLIDICHKKCKKITQIGKKDARLTLIR